jgi:hypothetical protein
MKPIIQKIRVLATIAFFALASQVLMTSCGCITGTGPVVQKEREIRKARHVVVNLDADIILSQTNEPKVVVTTNPNVQKYIKVRQQGDVITIKSSRCFGKNPNLTIEIGLPEPESVTLNSDAQLKTTGNRIDVKSFTLVSTGNGVVNMILSTVDLNIKTTARSKVFVNGFTGNLNLELSDRAQFFGLGTPASTANVQLQGSSKAQVQVQKKLEAKLDSGTTLDYRGKKGIEVAVSGEGRVKELE